MMFILITTPSETRNPLQAMTSDLLHTTARYFLLDLTCIAFIRLFKQLNVTNLRVLATFKIKITLHFNKF